MPFQRGKDLAKQYKVEPYLRTLFNYEIPKGESDTFTPTKEMVQAAQKARDGPKIKKATASPRVSPGLKRERHSSAKPGGAQFHTSSMTPSPLHPSFSTSSPSIPASPQWPQDQPPRKRFRAQNSPPPMHQFEDEREVLQQLEQHVAHPSHHYSHHSQHGDPYVDHHGGHYGGYEPYHEEPQLHGEEKYRAILMSIFLSDDQDMIPDLLTDPATPSDLDINLVIDDQGHTALHWAAALAKTTVLDLLVQKYADIRRVNYNGESALIRAVLVTNNFDNQSFPRLLDILHTAIPLVDRKNRTLLHHIAITAGMRGREMSARYYMECLLDWIARHGGDFSSIVDVQDRNGDTALTIAARVGDRYLAKALLDVGANREIENKVGLKAEDFGMSDIKV